ncbi:MAG: LysR family transcriptional regulator [Proteobacteria bacterium]|nr:LysR family transcriptional regulator [Pseudomonadota bacterium]
MTVHGRVDEMAWSDLRIVLAIGRAGSLSGAARSLGCTHSTVYRKIGAIEANLGVRFFERLPSGYELTEAGVVAMRFATRIQGEFDALHREVTGLDSELVGHIVLTAPAMMVAGLLPPLLAKFRRLHPAVTLEVVAGHQALDLRRRQADLAIRATDNPPEDSLGRRICDFRFGFYASRDYLADHGDRPLAEQDIVCLDGIIGWFVPWLWKTKKQAEERVVLRSNNVAGLITAARAGMGVIPMSCYSCDPHDDLVRLSFAPEKDMALWILIHPDLRRTARVKALKAFLTEELLQRASLFDGTSRPE